MMKKFAMLALVLACCVALCACGGDSGNDNTGETTTAPIETTTAPVETTEPADDGLVDYTVTVTDENGDPIVGALVQLCMDTCYPTATGDDGVARFHVAEADYKVSFLTMPAGYEHSGDAQEFYFDDGSYDMTIVLKAAQE